MQYTMARSTLNLKLIQITDPKTEETLAYNRIDFPHLLS